MAFPENRANQVICTGISLVILGFGVFTLSFILSTSKTNLGFIFQIGVSYWAAIPVSQKQAIHSCSNVKNILLNLVVVLKFCLCV